MDASSLLITGQSAGAGAWGPSEKVLVWAHGLSIGDFVHSIPLFRALRPHCKELHLSADAAHHLLVSHEKLFDVLTCELSPPPYPQYDLLVEIVSHPSRFKRSPVPVKRHLAFSTCGRQSRDRHTYQLLQEQLRNAGLFAPDTRPVLNPSAEDKAWAEQALKAHGMGEASDFPRVGLHVGAGFKGKLWPVARFASLADRLVEMYDARIALFFGPSDMDFKEEMIGRMGRPPAAIVQDCSLAQVSALIAGMDLFVSCESGLMHLADALEVPLVAVFGPTHPGTSGPVHADGFPVFSRPKECNGCDHARAAQCDDRKCLEDISVETVLVHIDRALDRASCRHRGPRARYVWNDQTLEHKAPPELRRHLASQPHLVAMCRSEVPYTREHLAKAMGGPDTGDGHGSSLFVEALCNARMLVPSWYKRVQGRRQGRLLSVARPRHRTPQPRPHMLYAVARETDAAEMLTLLVHLPDSWDASVLVSRRHPVMGTLLSRYAIPYRTYETADDFYAKADELQPDVIVWASRDGIDRYDSRYRHVFVDQGMQGKGHPSSHLKMGSQDFSSFAMVCMPNRFTYLRTMGMGYGGRLELTGYFKGDIYHAKMPYPRREILQSLELDPTRPLAVYCPTNIDWTGAGTLDQFHRWVLEGAEKAGMNLIIRPHEEDYIQRPWALEQIRKNLRACQRIVLDWDSPLWIAMADAFVGDASSTNLEAVMAGVPAILLPATLSSSVEGSDKQVADLHREIIHRALPVAASPEHLAQFLRDLPSPQVNDSLIAYFNEYFDGQVHARFFQALDKLVV